MHFTEAGVKDFLEIFEKHKTAIRNFEGCMHLELLKDVNDNLVYTTLSHWRDEASLDRYRASELFVSVWGRVKTMFSGRTQAVSLARVSEA
jgi:quinol monooxygenase YgiN